MASSDGLERLRATFQAAQDLGLSEEAIWAAVLEVVDSTPPGRPAGESIDAVAEALAKRIEEKRGE
jgi:hypothetical protein